MPESPDRYGGGGTARDNKSATTIRSGSCDQRDAFWRREKYDREESTVTDARPSSPEEQSARLVAESFVSDVLRDCSSSALGSKGEVNWDLR